MAQKKPIHTGHRQRMHERVRNYGFDSLAEHEALEYLLYFSIPRGDTNPTAHALIERFGSLARVLEATEEELCQVEGVGPASARMLSLLPQVSRYYRRSRARDLERFATTEEMGQYLMAQFHGKPREEALLVALDAHGRVRQKVWLSLGGIHQMALPVKQIVTEAARLGASSILLAHNHPSGLALPSREDIDATRAVQRGLALVGVKLRDHIIVTETEYCSLRDENRMPELEEEEAKALAALQPRK